MSLVINKYQIFSPCTAFDPKQDPNLEIPSTIDEGTTFEITGIDSNGFVLRDTRKEGQNLKYTFCAEVFKDGFYKVGDI